MSEGLFVDYCNSLIPLLACPVHTIIFVLSSFFCGHSGMCQQEWGEYDSLSLRGMMSSLLSFWLAVSSLFHAALISSQLQLLVEFWIENLQCHFYDHTYVRKSVCSFLIGCQQEWGEYDNLPLRGMTTSLLFSYFSWLAITFFFLSRSSRIGQFFLYGKSSLSRVFQVF